MANNQAKKVLIFSTAYLPLVGGAEIAVNEITKRLPAWQFDLITAKIQKGLKKEERINNVNVYRVGIGLGLDKYLLPFLGLIKAKKLERKNNYVSTWSIMASFGGFLGLRFKKKYPNKLWLLTLQEGDDPKYILRRVGIFKKWFYQIFEKADYIQAISKFLSDWAKGIVTRKEKVYIVPNGVDISIFKKQDKQVIQRLRKELNIQEDEKVILTVSRLVKKNGVDDLIKAGKHLEFPFKILIVGIGEQEKELKNLTKKLGIEDKVIFQGYVDYINLPKYYSIADVFVRASLSEGFGNVFLEAMACGVPIIGTKVGGIPDFLADPSEHAGQGNGMFCQINNPKNIAKKIKEVLENDSLKNLVVEKGIGSICQWDNIARRMETFFEGKYEK